MDVRRSQLWNFCWRTLSYCPRLHRTGCILLWLPLFVLMRRYLQVEQVAPNSSLDSPDLSLMTLLILGHLSTMFALFLFFLLPSINAIEHRENFRTRQENLKSLRVGMITMTCCAVAQYLSAYGILELSSTEYLYFFLLHCAACLLFGFFIFETSYACVNSSNDYKPVVVGCCFILTVGAVHTAVVNGFTDLTPLYHCLYTMTIGLLAVDTFTVCFYPQEIHFLRELIGLRVEVKQKNVTEVQKRFLQSFEVDYLNVRSLDGQHNFAVFYRNVEYIRPHTLLRGGRGYNQGRGGHN